MFSESSQLKVALLALAASSHYIGLRAPNSPPSESDKIYKGQPFEKLIHFMSFASRVSTHRRLYLVQ